MTNCAGCEILPGPLPTTGRLCLWPPLGHTHGKLQAGLVDRGIVDQANKPNCLMLDVSAEAFIALREVAADELSRVEQDQCKCLLIASGAEPSIDDLGRVESLTRLLAQLTGRWLVELLAERRFVTHFQPIVQTDAPEQVFAYECLLRGIGADGQLVAPAKLYAAARDAGLMYHLDRSARLQHIASASRYGLSTPVFINFNPTSIYDPEYCLRGTVAAIHEAGLPPENFVFEVVETDFTPDIERLPTILDFYRNAGFRIALDDLGAGYSSLNFLSILRPDFIKLDMQLIRGIDSDPYKGRVVGNIINTAHSLGIQVVAEGIETVGEWNWVALHGADLAQGFLFGRPTEEPQPSLTTGMTVGS